MVRSLSGRAAGFAKGLVDNGSHCRSAWCGRVFHVSTVCPATLEALDLAIAGQSQSGKGALRVGHIKLPDMVSHVDHCWGDRPSHVSGKSCPFDSYEPGASKHNLHRRPLGYSTRESIFKGLYRRGIQSLGVHFLNKEVTLLGSDELTLNRFSMFWSCHPLPGRNPENGLLPDGPQHDRNGPSACSASLILLEPTDGIDRSKVVHYRIRSFERRCSLSSQRPPFEECTDGPPDG